MVLSANERSSKKPAKQEIAEDTPKPIKINGSTHYDFEARNLTAYGGLLPVAAMLEKLKFQQLVEETLTVKRGTRVDCRNCGVVVEEVHSFSHGRAIPVLFR